MKKNRILHKINAVENVSLFINLMDNDIFFYIFITIFLCVVMTFVIILLSV